jgi:hypothetical protein
MELNGWTSPQMLRVPGPAESPQVRVHGMVPV